MSHSPNFERWERIEPYLLVVAAALLIGTPAIRFAFGHGGLVQFLLVPFGFWCVWQAFYEDRLDEGLPPSKAERFFAFSWVWTRRVTVGSVGLAFLIFSAYGLLHYQSGDALGISTALFLGVFSLWVAFYGAGRQRSMTDDREIHLKRKARYKWRS
jgi:hypothetical protein